MQTFRTEVHAGNIFGDDINFANRNVYGVANCAVKQLKPTIIAPVTSGIARSAELQHYDQIAEAVAELESFKNAGNGEEGQNFKAILVLWEIGEKDYAKMIQPRVNNDKNNSTANNVAVAKISTAWEGKILDERHYGGKRYFIPSSRSEPISLYVSEVPEYKQLYAGSVVGVIGSVVHRDPKTNAATSVAVTRIFVPPSSTGALNPEAHALLALPTANNNAQQQQQHPAAHLIPQRIHFCPIPDHLEGDDTLVENFLRDTILYLGRERSSSLLVFTGPLIGRLTDPASVYRSNMSQKLREIIKDAAAKYAIGTNSMMENNNATNCRRDGRPLPLMFVPDIHDAALRPAVIPQSNLNDIRELERFVHDAERNPHGFVHLPPNPAIFYSNGTLNSLQASAAPVAANELNALTIVATTIDFQSTIVAASASKGGASSSSSGSANQRSAIPKLDVTSETLLRSGLCVPFIHNNHENSTSGYEEFVVEHSSLPELAVTPHIHFSPTRIVSQPQAVMQPNGTLFLSLNVGPPSFAVGGKCSVLEVDVLPTERNTTPKVLTKDNVRVKCIDFIRYDNK